MEQVCGCLKKQKWCSPKDENTGGVLTTIAPNPDDLINRTFLTSPDEHGTRNIVRVVELVNKFKAEVQGDPRHAKFKLMYNNLEENGKKDTDYEDIMAYNEIIDHMQLNKTTNGTYWKYHSIIGHQHTPRGHPDQNGSDWNVHVE